MTPHRYLLAAALLAAAATAEVPTSPACALLTDAEAAALTGGAPKGAGQGSGPTSTASCSWDGGHDRSLGIDIIGPAFFAEDATTAADKFDLMLAGFRSMGVAFQTFPDVGDRAVLIIDGGGLSKIPTGNMALTVLKGDSQLSVVSVGISSQQTVDVGRLVASRLKVSP